MNYVRGVLSGLAAIFIAEFVFARPFLSGTKVTGLALVGASPISPRFWIVGILLFGLFFAASRLHNKFAKASPILDTCHRHFDARARLSGTNRLRSATRSQKLIDSLLLIEVF
jgi:hypothetical protein